MRGRSSEAIEGTRGGARQRTTDKILSGPMPCYHRPSPAPGGHGRGGAAQARADRSEAEITKGNAGVFTGLVEALGRVERADREGAGCRFTIAWDGLPEDEPLELGESIAVNGCCLTVVAIDGGRFEVQAGPESLARTNLGARRAGDRVNLERALKVGDRLGGHFVQGHIDSTATLRERRLEGEWEFLVFAIDPAWSPLLVPKG